MSILAGLGPPDGPELGFEQAAGGAVRLGPAILDMANADVAHFNKVCQGAHGQAALDSRRCERVRLAAVSCLAEQHRVAQVYHR
jgi:hypothetical protein